MSKNNILVLAIFLLGFVNNSFSQESFKKVKAARSSSPQIDGLFNNSEWQLSDKATNFIQLDPKEGEPATEKTETYILYDENKELKRENHLNPNLQVPP